MKFLDRIVNWIRPFAIPNLTIGIIVLQVIIYFMSLSRPEVLGNCVLIPAKVLEGEVWRLLSFLFMPPAGGMFLLTLLYWWVFYFVGNSVESYWGAARYNLYVLIGYLATVAVAFLVPNQMASNGFFYGTVFLAFAYLFPEFTFRLYFILPVKVKWLAWLQWVLYGFMFVSGPNVVRVAVVASVLNFLLFFGPDIYRWARQKGRQTARKGAQLREGSKARHTCAVCNATEITHPKMEFRYCSKCEGALCYCSEHLAGHEHVT